MDPTLGQMEICGSPNRAAHSLNLAKKNFVDLIAAFLFELQLTLQVQRKPTQHFDVSHLPLLPCGPDTIVLITNPLLHAY